MKSFKQHIRNISLASSLPSYKPVNILLRFVIISLIAIALLNLIVFVIKDDNTPVGPIPLKYYITFIAAFFIAGEIQIALDNLLEKALPIPYKVRLRLVLQIIIGLVVLLLTLFLIMETMDPQAMNERTKPGIFMGLISGLLFVNMTANALILIRFTDKWTSSQKQISDMKREKLEMDYNSLQDKLNPHFLFNNLSVLKSLIIYDNQAAVKFTEDFTDVYRYVLQSKDKRLVCLPDEFSFIESYINLHKERLGDGLQVSYSVEKESSDKRIAPLTLQLLIENAIKHNVSSYESPLKIHIETKKKVVRITNNIQLKETSYSTQTGLTNLIKRYEYLTEKKIRIVSNEREFVVEVPLL